MKSFLTSLFVFVFFSYANASNQPCKPAKKATPDTPVCINVMKTFTPNGDGKDDVWKIGNMDCIVHAQVKVYNRWGSLEFESKDYKNDWNGTKKEKPLHMGTYYYIIVARLIDDSVKELKGDVTILR